MADFEDENTVAPEEEEAEAAENEAEEEEEDSEEVPDAEKLAIVQHLLLNSPPGQFEEVKTDTLALVSEDLVSPAMMAGICRAYNTANLRVVDHAGRKVLVCKVGEITPTHYLDPTSRELLAVDHVALTAEKVDDADAPAPGPLEAERVAVNEAVATYVESQFSDEALKAGACYASDGGLEVVISGERANLRNFWSGNWRSTWSVSAGEAEGTVDIMGSIKVRAHYFEDGNVQLQTAKEYAAVPLKYSDPGSLAAALLEHVSTCEGELQKGLEEMYSNMSTETFKAMRRVMPITRTKMKWNIHEIALNRNLRK